MKLQALYAFFALSVVGLVVAGCQGNNGSNALPGTNAPAGVQSRAAAGSPSRLGPSDHGNPCGGGGDATSSHWGGYPPCAPTLVTVLNFDGANFSATSGGCGFSGLQNATPYTAPTSGPLTLSGSVSVTPTCVPSPPPSASPQLYIVAVQIPSWNARHHHVVIPAWDGGHGQPPGITLVAGPATLSETPWSFAPLSPGLTMQSGAKYIFAVFAVPAQPSPSPSSSPTSQPSIAPIQFVVAQLAFDGTNFTVPSGRSCGFRGFGNAQPYTAPTSGPLVLGGSVSIAPTCVPSPLPYSSASPQLYIVAVEVPGHRHGHDSRDCGHWSGWHGGGGHCGPAFGAIEIAGPASLSANPWSFAPLSPGLTMTAGTQYIFFVATLRASRPTPSPSASPSIAPSESPSPAPTESPSPSPYPSPT